MAIHSELLCGGVRAILSGVDVEGPNILECHACLHVPCEVLPPNSRLGPTVEWVANSIAVVNAMLPGIHFIFCVLEGAEHLEVRIQDIVSIRPGLGE